MSTKYSDKPLLCPETSLRTVFTLWCYTKLSPSLTIEPSTPYVVPLSDLVVNRDTTVKGLRDLYTSFSGVSSPHSRWTNLSLVSEGVWSQGPSSLPVSDFTSFCWKHWMRPPFFPLGSSRPRRTWPVLRRDGPGHVHRCYRVVVPVFSPTTVIVVSGSRVCDKREPVLLLLTIRSTDVLVGTVGISFGSEQILVPRKSHY